MTSVISITEDFQPIWSADQAFTASFNLFKSKIPEISQLHDTQKSVITGVATDKMVKRMAMIDKALFIANRVRSYATVTRNLELLECVKFTRSYLIRAKDADVLSICDNIYAKASLNITNLGVYCVNPSQVAALQASIADFNDTLSKPRVSKIDAKNATLKLKLLFKEMMNILVQRLDLDIIVFKETNPDFYEKYHIAREIVSRGINTSAILAFAKDKTTTQPLQHVSFTFTPGNNGSNTMTSPNGHALINKKTAKKGRFRVTSMPAGAYTVAITKLGYKQQSITVYIIHNETTAINVELEKL